ncbi:MAG: hypothetical protein DUD35_05840 [Lactobacillus sp.]|nr:hypothetical protein [Lentilactobacillus hilgardii]RRG11722.1 MAG: hypothetical protein DUD35_05840 [Lactobacillus sp.]
MQHFIGYLKDDNQVLQLFFLHARIGTVGLKMERYYFKKQLFQRQTASSKGVGNRWMTKGLRTRPKSSNGLYRCQNSPILPD